VSALYFSIGFQVSFEARLYLLQYLGWETCMAQAGIAMLESEMHSLIFRAWQLAELFHPLPETASRLLA